MALLVEDGTGIVDAEAYVSVAVLRAYAEGRGHDISGSTDLQCEIQSRLAAQWIDTRGRYKAVKLTASQGLEFPRSGLVDWSGQVQIGVPKRVRDAACELAIRGLGGASLLPDVAREDFVKSEAVGPISTTYRDDAPVSTVFSSAERLLEPFLRDKSQSFAPFFGGGTEGAFSFGMTSNPPTQEDFTDG